MRWTLKRRWCVFCSPPCLLFLLFARPTLSVSPEVSRNPLHQTSINGLLGTSARFLAPAQLPPSPSSMISTPLTPIAAPVKRRPLTLLQARLMILTTTDGLLNSSNYPPAWSRTTGLDQAAAYHTPVPNSSLRSTYLASSSDSPDGDEATTKTKKRHTSKKRISDDPSSPSSSSSFTR